MGIDPKNNDVLELLKKLKENNGAYPQELFAVRRQGYLRQVAAIGGGAGLASGLRNTVKSGKGAALHPVTGTLLEGLLVIAIVAEVSTVAYFYRDKFAKLLQNFSNQPKVEEVTNPPVISSAIPGLELTPSPVITETETAVGTPSLLAEQPTQPGSNPGSTGNSAVSTLVPNGNNGNQYGHTPIPKRTKEPGNSNNQDSQSDLKKKN
jgi:hypothetical protein